MDHATQTLIRKALGAPAKRNASKGFTIRTLMTTAS